MPTIDEIQKELDSLRNGESPALLTKEVKIADATALGFYLQAVKLAARAKSQVDEAKSSHSLGSIYRDLGALKKAQAAYERAFVLKQDLYGDNDVSTDKTREAIINVIRMRVDKEAPTPTHMNPRTAP